MRLYDPRLTFVVVMSVMAVGVALGFLRTPHLIDVSCAPAPGPVLHCRSKASSLIGLPMDLRTDVQADSWRAGLFPLAPKPPTDAFDDLEAKFEYRRKGMGSDSRLVLRFGYGHPVAVTPWLPMGDGDFSTLSRFSKQLQGGNTATFQYRSGWADWVPLVYVLTLVLLSTFAASGRARVRVDPEQQVVEIVRRRRWLAKPEQRTVPLGDVASVAVQVVDESVSRSPWEVQLVPRDGQPIALAMPVKAERARHWAKAVRTLLALETEDG